MIEGSNASKFAQLIKKIGFNEFDRLDLATIISVSPVLRIQVDNMKIELDASDVIVAEHLTDHERIVTIKSDLKSDPDSISELDKGLSSSDDIENAILTVKSPLNTGDRVIVASANSGQSYVILDKAVIYRGT
ncbi:DUF2577 family protein [Paenibacillus sp. UNC451MF]|uniref:DUF2577 family protein n=1 Tax=Paenibacillus sp. UNC451MF TaxID=1449063 RepID=UPI0004919C5A|nr:DUF2577 family protein [Paenibacillus sp. UNC451MF]